MKLHTYSVAAALVTAAAFLGCSADHSQQTAGNGGSGKDGSMSFNLLASPGVQIDAINYDLKTQTGTEVISSSIPVKDNDQSQHVPVLGLQSLTAGDYSLTLSATGKLSDGSTVPCTTTSPSGFSVQSGKNTFVGDIALTCKVTTAIDTHGSATADVSVTVTSSSQDSVLETFSYGPRSASGKLVGGSCAFQPIQLKIQNTNSAIAYTWSVAPTGDGSFADIHGVSTTYQCASDGDKTITLSGTLGSVTSTSSFTVHCDATPCGFACGNGKLEGSEQCDDGLPHCDATCHIVPVCGDTIIDAPETCEPPGTVTCDASCKSRVATCGDGFVNQSIEQCDNGTTGATPNSNAPNATCRTDCTTQRCGDNIVDDAKGEQCDPPNTASCDASCKTKVAKDQACVACIKSSGTSAAGLQTTYIDGDSLAAAVESCVINAVCWSPLPAACFCGSTQSDGTTDVGVCSQSTFTAHGPCVTQIKAGNAAGATNDDIVSGLFDFGTSSGAAFGVLQNAFAKVSASCKATCFQP